MLSYVKLLFYVSFTNFTNLFNANIVFLLHVVLDLFECGLYEET